jgi:hypothetical protein
MFPLTITFSEKLPKNFDERYYGMGIQTIKHILTENKGRIKSIEDDGLTFKGSHSYWRGSICKGVDKGAFKIQKKNNKVIVIYKIFFYELFIFTSIAGIVFGAISQEIWVGIGIFLWLGGMNWITAIIRHQSMLKDIALEIDRNFNNLNEKSKRQPV